MASSCLYEGDCLQILPQLPDNSVDMICCDLPYGMTSNAWDSVIPLEPLWQEYKRIAKPNAAIVLTAMQPFASQLVLSTKDFKYEWIWEKAQGTGFLNAKKQPLRSHESVLVFYQQQCTYNPEMVPGRPYTCVRGDQSSSNYRDGIGPWTTENHGERYPTTILRFNYDSNKVHPTQKPVALLTYLIKTYTNEGDTVLDNCMGSGSTGVACVNLRRNFIGMEMNHDYFTLAQGRIEQAERDYDNSLWPIVAAEKGDVTQQL